LAINPDVFWNVTLHLWSDTHLTLNKLRQHFPSKRKDSFTPWPAPHNPEDLKPELQGSEKLRIPNLFIGGNLRRCESPSLFEPPI